MTAVKRKRAVDCDHPELLLLCLELVSASILALFQRSGLKTEVNC